VYRVTRTEDGCEIRFALGASHGVGPGTIIYIFNDTGRQVGTGSVEVSDPTNSVARVTSDQEIKVGDVVSRK